MTFAFQELQKAFEIAIDTSISRLLATGRSEVKTADFDRNLLPNLFNHIINDAQMEKVTNYKWENQPTGTMNFSQFHFSQRKKRFYLIRR